MKKDQLDITDHKIWKDKNINPEAKEVYSYLYEEALNRITTCISIGRVQGECKHIKNKAFKKILNLLEQNNYIVFREYDNGLYEYKIC